MAAWHIPKGDSQLRLGHASNCAVVAVAHDAGILAHRTKPRDAGYIIPGHRGWTVAEHLELVSRRAKEPSLDQEGRVGTSLDISRKAAGHHKNCMVRHSIGSGDMGNSREREAGNLVAALAPLQVGVAQHPVWLGDAVERPVRWKVSQRQQVVVAAEDGLSRHRDPKHSDYQNQTVERRTRKSPVEKSVNVTRK
jgi:hypothetical protein